MDGSVAIRRVQAFGLEKAYAGAIAFSRGGDPNLDEFEEAVILKTFGRVPEDFGATDSA